jgi:LEA14-like dessication related protein
MKYVQLTLLVLVINLFLSACSYNDVEVKNLTINNFSTDNNKIQVDLNIEVDNPNAYAIVLSQPNFEINVAGQKIENWKITNKIKLPAKSTNTHAIHIEVEGAQVMRIIPMLLFNPEIKIQGNFKAKAFLIAKKINVDIQERIY